MKNFIKKNKFKQQEQTKKTKDPLDHPKKTVVTI
jgi:hypothetical protein